MELPRHPLSRARQGAALAPAQAGAIIGADARNPGYFRLHHAPVQRPARRSRLQHDSRTACADAIQMEPVAADVNHLAGRWMLPAIEHHADDLIQGPHGRECHERTEKPFESAHGGYDPS